MCGLRYPSECLVVVSLCLNIAVSQFSDWLFSLVPSFFQVTKDLSSFHKSINTIIYWAHGNILRLFMVSAMFVFSYILICFVKTTTYWDSLLQGVSKNPHVCLCRFVPLGRRSSDHWCFSCCLPGGEWGKGPNGSPTGTTGDKHREPGHICLVLKWNLWVNGLSNECSLLWRGG